MFLTKVNIQQSSVGSLHQDLLTGSSERFVHEVHTVSHQRTQPLGINLSKQSQQTKLREKATHEQPPDDEYLKGTAAYLHFFPNVMAGEAQMEIITLIEAAFRSNCSVNKVTLQNGLCETECHRTSHLQLLQLAVNIDVQVWIHGQEVVCQHTKPARTQCDSRFTQAHSMQHPLYVNVASHISFRTGCTRQRGYNEAVIGTSTARCCHLLAEKDTDSTVATCSDALQRHENQR